MITYFKVVLILLPMCNFLIKLLIESILSSSLANLNIVNYCDEGNSFIINGLVALLLYKHMSLFAAMYQGHLKVC